MLYIYTVFCEIIPLRLDGRKLCRSEWPPPIRGDLRLGWRSEEACALGRPVHELYVIEGVGAGIKRIAAVLLEPRMVKIHGASMIWAGTTTAQIDGRPYEVIQSWLVTPMGPDHPFFTTTRSQ